MSNELVNAKAIVIQPKCSTKSLLDCEFQQQIVLAAYTYVEPCVCLIDLSELTCFDNETVKTFFVTYRLAKSLGQRLCFCSIPPEGRIIFELLQLDRVFEIYESRAAFEAAVIAN